MPAKFYFVCAHGVPTLAGWCLNATILSGEGGCERSTCGSIFVFGNIVMDPIWVCFRVRKRATQCQSREDHLEDHVVLRAAQSGFRSDICVAFAETRSCCRSPIMCHPFIGGGWSGNGSKIKTDFDADDVCVSHDMCSLIRMYVAS